jgi:hypothetical protein
LAKNLNANKREKSLTTLPGFVYCF